ncbi:MAG: hypothetical protein H0V81_04190 [Solirubrobacterales bacterium]|nr:hypothetical protein [Solirubrobacterales bacterium]
MTARSRATLNTNADTDLADNTAGAIGALDVRTSVKDLADSATLLDDVVLRLLDADVAHGNDAVLKQWFATAGAVTVPLTGTYRIEGELRLMHGVTSHTTSLAFAGTATVSWIEYQMMHWTAGGANTANTLITVQTTKSNSTAAATVQTGAGTTGEENIWIRGLVRFSAVGTFIPQFNYSTNPAVTTLTKRGTFFSMQYLGDASFTTRGTWA